MIFEPDTVKGFQDFLPPESQKRNAVKKIVEDQFLVYGFLPMETPLIEFDELMRSDSLGEEDEAISDRFRLKDKAGRNLGIRYEFTFQLARIFKQNPNIKMPFRRYQIEKNLRDEPTGPGRFKEFTQCDIDVIGDSSQECEAECISAWSDILKNLGIKAEFHVNNRKLINSILESIKIVSKEEVMKELDKIDKIGEDEVKSNLKKYADSMQILTIFKMFEKNLDFFVDNLFDGADEIKKLEKNLKNYGVKTVFNPFLVRGLSYYTGNIIEIKIQGQKSSIGGGGRYDKLVGKYLGREIPAFGLSCGLERLTELAKIKINAIRVIVISLNQNSISVKTIQKLRKNDISSIIFYGKPGKALEYANSYQIKNAIFIGEDEVSKKKFKLRDLSTGNEKMLTEKQLIAFLKD